MKKYIIHGILIFSLLITLDKTTDYISNLLVNDSYSNTIVNNEYKRDYNFNFVKENKDLVPYSKEEIKDVIYTILNSGENSYTFYCPKEYDNCITDLKEMFDDDYLFNNINNFVNPHNSFDKINVSHHESGEVTIKVTKLYDELTSKKIEEEVNKLFNELKKDNDKDTILSIHDYIINTTKYDRLYEEGNSNYQSFNAYGPLFEGYATCAGYTDLMALFLDKLNIKNYKVSTDDHIWNAVYIDDSWLHLDLTWDDPVDLNTNKDTLIHKFYLIDDNVLKDYKTDSHSYDNNIFSEFKNLEF